MLENIVDTNKYLSDLFINDNKRKNYQSYVLRFFALKNFTEYASSIDKTMNDYMAKHQYDDEKTIQEHKKLFTGTIDIIKQILGNDAFCAYDRQNNAFMNKFSGSVYDSISIAFSMFNSHDLMMNADKIRQKITDIKINNQDYHDFTYAATGSKDRVIGRIMLIYNAIKDIIGKYSDSQESRFFTKLDKEKLWKENYTCSYCNQKILSIEDAEVDHIFAFSNGGTTTLNNAQLLHRHCNREKSNKIVESDNANFEENDE